MGPVYARKFDPVRAKERRERGIVSPDAINEGFAGFLRRYDVTDQLDTITCPTLVIAGRYDWICPPEFSELIASKIPHADLRIFEESGHAVSGDESEKFLDLVRGFIVYNQAADGREHQGGGRRQSTPGRQRAAAATHG
jgi:proline iminopeptidase